MNTYDEPPRYRLRLFPPRGRFPRAWWHWYRLTIVVVLVAAIPLVFVPLGLWLSDHIPCSPGFWPSSDSWSQGGECVGVSDGPFDFGQARFDQVLKRIADQNAAAGKAPCGGSAGPVTVGVLLTLTSPNNGGRAVHELEGIATAQALANGPDCVHPIRLLVGQMGAGEQAAASVAKRLADGSHVVTVVGMGLSDQHSADAAAVLVTRRIPMVSDLITAEGFDQRGSAQDQPDFSTCDPGATYTRGVGQGFFYRVSFRNGEQIRQLDAYIRRNLGNRLGFIMTPTSTDDPYTCTALPLLHRAFGSAVDIRFDRNDAETVRESAARICGTNGPVNVLYTARASDLPRFMQGIEQRYADGLCQPSCVTILSASDAERIRAAEPDPKLEQLRTDALNSARFRDGTLRLIYTPLADPDAPVQSASPGFASFERGFTGAALRFSALDLDDGWAINGYNALITVSNALRQISAQDEVTGSQVNDVISGFSIGSRSNATADGNLTFGNDGNRTDSPVVVQVCPPASDGRTPLPRTAEVYPFAGICR